MLCNQRKRKDPHKDCDVDLHCAGDRDDHTDKCDDRKDQGACVEEVLEAILRAQRKVKREDECHTSCKESIDDLLGKSKKSKKNTIPFILFCGDCEPFKATGVTTVLCHSKKKKFVCKTSFIFRIKDLKNHCAVLELLTFKNKKDFSSDPYKKGDKIFSSPCCQIDHENVDDLVKTGICINVDLSCICAITCLPAVCL